MSRWLHDWLWVLLGCVAAAGAAAGDGLSPSERAARIVAVEEAVLEVSPLLGKLANSLAEDGGEGGVAGPLAAAVPVVHPPAAAAPTLGPGDDVFGISEWPLEEGEGTAVRLPPWPGLVRMMEAWEAPKFGTVAAVFSEGTAGDLVLDTKFEAGATGRDGARYGVKAKQRITWRKSDDGTWAIVGWEQKGLTLERAASLLFDEVLDTAVPDRWTREALRRSRHEVVTATALRDGRLEVPAPEYADVPDMESAYFLPTVSVVDYDGDGWDDLFVSERLGRPYLLRNRGDGTFVDVTARAGLAIENSVNSALFADFDNDGDPDVLLGRAIEPSLYLVNDGGRFRDRTAELTDLGQQYFVACMAAADVNRDGLPDVYLSTYSPGTDVLPVWKERYLRPGEAEKLDALQEGAHPYLDDRGAPNVLLMNRGGGRLERAGGEAVELWRKSYQPVWADIDGDGDDDLYVCNDFAPDSFLRNDTPPGAPEPVFVEAFAQSFPDGQMAFGMGASFGDRDRDGDLDLFVSNMYSKAGNRIIAMAGGADGRIHVAARGNFLYRNDDGSFRQSAAADGPETRVGWAFGGQFADFDNDGHLDLYVPSGYYSAPPSVATEVDL